MKSKNIKIFNWDIFNGLPLKTGITTRHGGVSKGSYSSLNLASHSGDSIVNVEQNRDILCNFLDIDVKSYTHCIQTHGDHIHSVNEHNIGLNSIEADALFTTSSNAFLNIYVADCIPIVVFDKKNMIGGICHCGWKGTYSKLLKKMINKLITEFGSEQKDILIGIGPGIESCCYNISEDLYKKFNPAESEGFIKNNKFYIDLKEINKNQALSLGINKENIQILNLCTSCNTNDFFSYRKEGESTGRFSCYFKLTS